MQPMADNPASTLKKKILFLPLGKKSCEYKGGFILFIAGDLCR